MLPAASGQFGFVADWALVRLTSTYRHEWTFGMSGSNQAIRQVRQRNANVGRGSREKAAGGKPGHGVPFQEHRPVGAKDEIGSPKMPCVQTGGHLGGCLFESGLHSGVHDHLRRVGNRRKGWARRRIRADDD